MYVILILRGTTMYEKWMICWVNIFLCSDYHVHSYFPVSVPMDFLSCCEKVMDEVQKRHSRQQKALKQ